MQGKTVIDERGHQTASISYQNWDGQQTYRANKTPYENTTAARGDKPQG